MLLRLSRFFLKVLVFSVLLLVNCKKNNNSPGPTIPPSTVEIKDSILVNGLQYPWEILWGPDNFIWMTERGGKISRVNPTTGAVIPVITIADVVASGEGGLVGMALHPNFPATPYVYVGYNYNNGSGYKEKIVRYLYSGATLISPTIILDNISASNIHNGCRLIISPDLKLYITTGDASDQLLPQNISSVNGKILRINLDGSIPSDNPVAGNPYWSFGHRNPQGLVFANNILYSSEHGPNSDDEINLIEKGRNYGWPNVWGYCDLAAEQNFCTTNNVKEPIKAWTPTAAVCGLDYYNSNLIPQWKNSLILVSLKDARFYQLKLNSSFNSITETKEFFNNKYGRMRDVCVANDGKIYIATSNGNNNDRLIVIDKK